MTRRRDGIADDLQHHRQGGIGTERHLAGQHLVENNAQGINVGGRADVRQSFGLFRSHVGRRPNPHAGPGHPLFHSHHLGNAKVGQDSLPFRGQHNVGRLNVPMHESALVGITQGRSDLLDDGDDLAKGAYLPPPGQVGFEVLAFDKFHDHVVKMILPTKIVHLNDIGVTQGGHSLSLALKSLPKACFGHKFGPDHLQSPVNSQARVKGFVHIGHSSPPQALNNPVLPNRLSDEISHDDHPLKIKLSILPILG